MTAALDIETNSAVDSSRKKLRDDLTLNTLAYVHHLSKQCKGGEFPKNVHPSAIQKALKSGRHLRSSLLRVSGADIQHSGCETCGITILNAKGVAPVGVRNRTPWLRLARVCFFDGRKFVANASGVAVTTTKNNGFTWIFKDQTLFVRWPTARSASLRLYFELNVSHELAEGDSEALPRQDHRAFQTVDEVTCCWAEASVQELEPGTASREVRLPLRCGKINDPQSHVELAHHHRRILCGPTLPSLTIRVERIQDDPPIPLSWLPPVSVCLSEVAEIACTYRSTLADKVRGGGVGCTIPVCDPVSSALPKLMDDEDIFGHFLRLWKHLINEKSPTSEADYASILRECTLLAAPLLKVHNVPSRRISNDLARKALRQVEVERCLWKGEHKTRAPRYPPLLEPESGQPSITLMHKPFNITEVKCFFSQ
ncbi:hypothetical protein BSKO_03807 [Bryopsis sp. KO-2023]|nr:hypothetical protein BSKO_03807 [Bryopsis sp. KO-2023]